MQQLAKTQLRTESDIRTLEEGCHLQTKERDLKKESSLPTSLVSTSIFKNDKMVTYLFKQLYTGAFFCYTKVIYPDWLGMLYANN